MKAERNLIKLLIDRAKDKHGIPSDAQLAGALGVTPQTLSQWKSRQIPITDERVIDLAKIAGDPPDLWLVMMQFDQAKTPAAKKSWEAAAVRLASAIDGLKLTAIAGLCAIGLAFPLLGKAHQTDVSPNSPASEIGSLHIMSKARWVTLGRVWLSVSAIAVPFVLDRAPP